MEARVEVLTDHEAEADEDLLQLGGERREEAAERHDEAADDGRQSRRLPATDGDHERRDQVRNREGQNAQNA